MDRQIQADKAFLEWMAKMSKNVVHIADAWYAAVKWADFHPHWIPVEKELPKADGRYIIADKYGGVEQMNFDTESKCWWLRGTGEMSDFVTHWMPKPMPPRKEGSDERG
jgi:hypothetical protein